MTDHYPFELKPLPYDYNALEPYIDAQTMEIHHNRHLKAYVDKLNAALKDYPQYHGWSLEQLLMNLNLMPCKIRTAVKNNGGGVYNHNLYFGIMGNQNNKPGSKTLKAITQSFGTYETFQSEFKKEALGRFGSGYAWLAADPYGCLKIVSTANQDTILPLCLTPILLIDVWEHAYYLKYKNLRGDYIDNWFPIINWEKVEQNLAAGCAYHE